MYYSETFKMPYRQLQVSEQGFLSAYDEVGAVPPDKLEVKNNNSLLWSPVDIYTWEWKRVYGPV